MERKLTLISIVLAAIYMCWLMGWPFKGAADQKERIEGRFRLPRGRVVTFEELSQRPSGPSVETQIEGDDIRVNQTGPAAETTILIDPLNPDHLVAAAMDTSQAAIRATPYVSFDGGRTWEQRNALSPFVRAADGRTLMFQNQSDPVLAADRGGNIYLSTIMWGTGRRDNGVYVFKSTNGGRRFSSGAPVVAHIGEDNPPFEDKEWITVDTTGGAFNDSLYVTWSSLPPGPAPGRILFSRSTDGGATFSVPHSISDDQDPNSNISGSMPRIGPNGELYVMWIHFRSDGPAEILIDKSADGGVTFGADVQVATATGNFSDPIRGLQRHFMLLPTLAIDRSSGLYGGNLYVIWADKRNADVDIFLSRSADGGTTWSRALRVNDDALGNGRDQMMPFVTVDQVTGTVVIGYYDRRESCENYLVDYRLAWSTDGGVSFEPSLRLTDQAFDPSVSVRFIASADRSQVCPFPFMGDYTSLVAAGGMVYPLWADTRNGRADVFTQPIGIR